MILTRTERNLLGALCCLQGGTIPVTWLKPYVGRQVKGLVKRRLLSKRFYPFWATITTAGRRAAINGGGRG